jgi:hypothetical protein
VIKAPQLLADLTRLLKRLEEDLLRRIDEVTELKTSLQAEWQAARDADRTAETFETWVDQVITQAGVHWLLSCVFLRFIEDNKLVDRPWLGGTPESGNLALARDRHEAYFRANPLHSDREYLLASFREAGTLPGLHTFFDEGHNPVFRLGISGDAAMAVRQFWQQVDPNTGALAHDFTDPTWNTRFLGDLYQDLSEATRKRYALLQTPEFVEEFILERTLTPAIREFGYRTASLIDPTCGSGHFLLGAFHRFVDEWQRAEPSRNRRDIAQKALDAVAGVDLNPFAVAISRFRLLVAALLASDVHKLSEAPDFRIHVAIGDSLLHGTRFDGTGTVDMYQQASDFEGTGLAHAYASEDLTQVQAILGRQYHAVVGNPPYIVVRDAALNAAYRKQYVSCHRQYSLGAPFTERFFDLALTGRNGVASGFVGIITANSFMKREFGTKLIEQVLPRMDLSHVIDTSGAYIPGHGTPTVILFGRHRAPVANSVRTVMGIKGEPSTPNEPAKGLVWSAILDQIDHVDSESEFISTADTDRLVFSKHPWSIGGGGAAELRSILEEDKKILTSTGADLGFLVITGEDGCLMFPSSAVKRLGFTHVMPIGEGDTIRDWCNVTDLQVLWPYDKTGADLPDVEVKSHIDGLWPYRTSLKERKAFGVPVEQKGLRWWDLREVYRDRLDPPLTITFAFVAPHNHFVLERGGKVFKQSAPVIKLPRGATEEQHLALLGLLNSSTACFWMKQVGHQKQMMGGDGIRVSERSKVPYEFPSTQLGKLPLPLNWPNVSLYGKLVELAREADNLAAKQESPSVADGIERGLAEKVSIIALWNEILAMRMVCRSRLIVIQEEIDFLSYIIYGLTDDTQLLGPTSPVDTVIHPGERPFCISSQKNVDGFAVPFGIPTHWPETMQSLWSHRIKAIKENANLRIIEEPHYKRRWIGRQGLFNHDARVDEFKAAVREWLLSRLELPKYWSRLHSAEASPVLMSSSKLADTAASDADFMQVAALYAGYADFDPHQLVADLVAAESVPFLPVLRYSDTGLRKRAQWEDTWTLQRQQDAGQDFGRIPAPPKYQSKDFVKTDFWRLRGGLDVPKERWISYPGCERGADGSLPIAWAGWDHLQQATALAAYYLEMKESEGWEAARLQPLLAGLLELVPWLEQWHNEVDPVYGERMGAYYKGFVAEEARSHGFTLDDLRAWKPAAVAGKRGRKAKS